MIYQVIIYSFVSLVSIVCLYKFYFVCKQLRYGKTGEALRIFLSFGFINLYLCGALVILAMALSNILFVSKSILTVTIRTNEDSSVALEKNNIIVPIPTGHELTFLYGENNQTFRQLPEHFQEDIANFIENEEVHLNIENRFRKIELTSKNITVINLPKSKPPTPPKFIEPLINVFKEYELSQRIEKDHNGIMLTHFINFFVEKWNETKRYSHNLNEYYGLENYAIGDWDIQELYEKASNKKKTELAKKEKTFVRLEFEVRRAHPFMTIYEDRLTRTPLKFKSAHIHRYK